MKKLTIGKMKKLTMLVAFIFVISSITMGCGAKRVNPDYMAYTQTLQAQFVASREPLVSIEVDIDGKIAGIVVNQPVRPINVEQKRPHAVWKVASGIVRMCGVVGSIWATGDAISGIVDAGSGNTSYINSGNDNSGNSGSIESNQIMTNTAATTTTTTTTTDTVTN